MAGQDTRAIIFEGCPKLALKVEARRLLELWLHPVMMVFPPVVHETQLRRDPADAALDDYETQSRKALRHCRRDQEGEAALHHEHFVVADLRVERNPRLNCERFVV